MAFHSTLNSATASARTLSAHLAPGLPKLARRRGGGALGRRHFAAEASTQSAPRYDVTATTLVLTLIPIVTFGLGTWQIKRLQWKVNLIEELDEKLSKPSMRLPAKIDTAAIPEFAYRKVEVTGQYDHSKEMLLGPRTREGVLGYSVVTPLIRDDGDASNAILVNRGHVSRTMKDRAARPESQVEGSQTIVGMLRDQDKRNMFTPPNSPEKGEYQFADIAQMASQCGTQPVLIDEVFEGNAGEMKSMISHGIPLGRAPTIELRNMHATYAITWYALSAATSLMLWRLFRRPAAGRANAFSRFEH